MGLQDSTIKCVVRHLIRCETSYHCHRNENQTGRVSFLYQGKIYLQSMRKIGKREFDIFLAKIMAAIFDFRERKKFVPRE